jgi:tRNA nucleotidyltransferase (CCA-adding enzyme)
MKNVNSILKEVLEENKIEWADLEIIEKSLKDFISDIEKKIKSQKINAEVFVGGSYAKGTMIKKDNYDIDLFLRFAKDIKDGEMAGICEKLLKGYKIMKIHGSRDYFRIGITPNIFFEVVPVRKISKPEEAENITDLSYSHVKYIKSKIKSEKIIDDIKIAKVFCYANKCYGAESYINGFSGYALELLIYYYGGFLKFIKEALKVKEKTVIDIEKQYKRKQEVLMDLNSSKLQSPIILIDPTYKQRNVLAALSSETFEKFRQACEKFLKSPGKEAFSLKKIDIENKIKNAKTKKYDFVSIKIMTDKQEGDIAGSKLLKFYRHLNEEIEKYFDVKDSGFEYNKGKSAEVFFSGKSKKEILFAGPFITDKANAERFKKEHKTTFVKSKKMYAKQAINFDLNDFLTNWKHRNEKKLKEMYITKMEIN